MGRSLFWCPVSGSFGELYGIKVVLQLFNDPRWSFLEILKWGSEKKEVEETRFYRSSLVELRSLRGSNFFPFIFATCGYWKFFQQELVKTWKLYFPASDVGFIFNFTCIVHPMVCIDRKFITGRITAYSPPKIPLRVIKSSWPIQWAKTDKKWRSAEDLVQRRYR